MTLYSIFQLDGTANQQAIVKAALERIKFPWDRLSPPSVPIPIGWQDLNGTANGSAVGGHYHGEIEGHGIERVLNGKRFIAGVFWSDGRIYIDYRCEANPAMAQEVVSAEISHSVDFFLPLSDAQKERLMALWHPAGPDAHTWWEVVDYGSEYARLGGEAFMAQFTHAYSDINPWDDLWAGEGHDAKEELSPQVWDILGIRPTDQYGVTSLGGYRTYHRETCRYVRRWRAMGKAGREIAWASGEIARSQGLVACKVCRP